MTQYAICPVRSQVPVRLSGRAEGLVARQRSGAICHLTLHLPPTDDTAAHQGRLHAHYSWLSYPIAVIATDDFCSLLCFPQESTAMRSFQPALEWIPGRAPSSEVRRFLICFSACSLTQ